MQSANGGKYHMVFPLGRSPPLCFDEAFVMFDCLDFVVALSDEASLPLPEIVRRFGSGGTALPMLQQKVQRIRILLTRCN